MGVGGCGEDGVAVSRVGHARETSFVLTVMASTTGQTGPRASSPSMTEPGSYVLTQRGG
jgi:hypothetical protein